MKLPEVPALFTLLQEYVTNYRSAEHMKKNTLWTAWVHWTEWMQWTQWTQ